MCTPAGAGWPNNSCARPGSRLLRPVPVRNPTVPVAANADSFYDNGSATDAVEDGSTMVWVLQNIHDGGANMPTPCENARMADPTAPSVYTANSFNLAGDTSSYRPVLDAHRGRRQAHLCRRCSRIPPAAQTMALELILNLATFERFSHKCTNAQRN